MESNATACLDSREPREPCGVIRLHKAFRKPLIWHRLKAVSTMRLRTKIIFALTIVAALLVLAQLPRHILGPRVVSCAVTPDGFEMCIVQHSSLDSLPWFTTSFISRKRGGGVAEVLLPSRRLLLGRRTSFPRHERAGSDLLSGPFASGQLCLGDGKLYKS